MPTVTGFIIDPQNGFMGKDDGSPYSFDLGGGQTFTATLPVKGATSDMDRLASWIGRNMDQVNQFYVTLDSHRTIDVAHPAMWVDDMGNNPDPFTIISVFDIKSGKWTPRDRRLTQRMIDYTAELERKGNYLLMVWPEHCLIGTPGHNVYAPLMEKLLEWERKKFSTINWVTKGSNPFVEHYGGLEAEVIDPNDPSTHLNMRVINALQKSDIVFLAGEASSHCVLTTIKQVVDHIGDQHLGKLHILTDCTSPVLQSPDSPDFPAIAEAFFGEMGRKGLKLVKTTNFLN